MTDAPPPKRPPGRPRKYASDAEAAAANVANTAAKTRARRAAHVVKEVTLSHEVAARADEPIARRGLRGYADLVTALVDEAHARDTTTRGGDRCSSAPPDPPTVC